jgi:hypothetical protein
MHDGLQCFLTFHETNIHNHSTKKELDPLIDVELKVLGPAGTAGTRSQVVCLPLQGPFHDNMGTT